MQIVSKEQDYGLEALERFKALTEGRKLVANVDHREAANGNLLHLRLIDPTDPNSAEDPMACLNADMIREGEWNNSSVPEVVCDIVHSSCTGRSTHSSLCRFFFNLEGLATIDKSSRYAQAYPQVVKKLQQAMEGAKRDRLGIFEYVHELRHIMLPMQNR